MKSIIILITCLTYSMMLMAQNNAPQLTVTGKAKCAVVPDWIEVIFNINVKGKEQSFVMTELNRQTGILSLKLDSLGYDHNLIKTSNINLREDYTYSSGKSRKNGYVGWQQFTLPIPLNTDKLSEIITKTYDNQIKNIELSFHVSLSDSLGKVVKNKLIRQAIEDAKNSAKTITESTGTKTKRIIDIKYHDLFFNRYYSEIMPPPAIACEIGEECEDDAPLLFGSFNIREYQVKDEVTVIWEIEGAQ